MGNMKSLSKSKLIAFRQCPKRLWLELYKPELREDSSATKARFRVGNQVGDIAQRLYDPKSTGAVVNAQTEGYPEAFARSTDLMGKSQPVFEAGFSADGAFAFADVMLPVRSGGRQEWRMIEVKSSASVKDYHRDDASIQAFVARAAGVSLAAVAVAFIDSKWVYPGDGNYKGLLKENDLTEETSGRAAEVKQWIADAHVVAKRTKEPKQKTGGHCSSPFECGFSEYCKAQEPQPKHSADVLPRMSPKLRAYIEAKKITELKDVPDELLSPIALRVKQHTLQNKPFFDAKGAATAMAQHKLPAVFLDFETTSMPVPIWAGARPFQQIPFQFSAHLLGRTGKLVHKGHLDLSGADPSKDFASALIEACGNSGPIFVYNASFERARITDLASRFRPHKAALLALNDRLVDLLPIAREHYYHPSQKGSWSIKDVLPAVVPTLGYDGLDGIKDGGMAAEGYLEAIHKDTSPERREQIRKQLTEYCRLDTYAMVRLWQVFASRKDLEI